MAVAHLRMEWLAVRCEVQVQWDVSELATQAGDHSSDKARLVCDNLVRTRCGQQVERRRYSAAACRSNPRGRAAAMPSCLVPHRSTSSVGC